MVEALLAKVVLATTVGIVVGIGVGLGARNWLLSRSYRYDGESEFKVPSVGWVVPTLAISFGLISVGWVSRPALLVLLSAYSAVLVVLAAIDLDVQRLPSKITMPLIPASWLGLGLTGLIEANFEAVLRALLGALALGGFYYLQVLLARGRGMGFGDVMLALSMGAVLGYLSWTHLIMATVVCYLTAGLWGLFLILFRGAGRKTHIAFGPHMVIGALSVFALPGIGALA